MQQGCVLASRAALPLLLSLVPAALSSDAGKDAAGAANTESGGDADKKAMLKNKTENLINVTAIMENKAEQEEDAEEMQPDDLGDMTSDGAEQEGNAEEMQSDDLGDMKDEGDAEVMEPAYIMKAMDQDEDGFLSLAEMTSEDEEQPVEKEEMNAMKASFDVADGNKDGKLSLDELPVWIKSFMEPSEDGANEEM
mmetsp:Transcript_109936/g.212831  ORF Transcript_109936/g.212831 Transcript_109936/m.212831 type:complete len:195 (+) Transcript_109936:1-585(+)